MYKGDNTVDKGLISVSSAFTFIPRTSCTRQSSALKRTEIISFSTRRLQPQEFQRFTRQTMEAYRTYAD